MSARAVFGSSTCKQCGLSLAFYRNAKGKAVPCNPDGSDHWDLCRDTRYAKAKKGALVRHEKETGGAVEQWERGKDKPFVVSDSSGPQRGEKFRQSASSKPPWE